MAAGAYQIQGAQLVTSTNNRYDFCAMGSSLAISWANGPNREPGVYGLTKQ
jgi:hypothetical protein